MLSKQHLRSSIESLVHIWTCWTAGLVLLNSCLYHGKRWMTLCFGNWVLTSLVGQVKYCSTLRLFWLVISPQNIIPKSLGVIKVFLANVRWAFMFLLISSYSCLAALPWIPFLPRPFLMVPDLIWGKQDLQVLIFLSRVFCDFLDWPLIHFWRHSGKIHHCSMFSPFGDNGTHYGFLEL